MTGWRGAWLAARVVPLLVSGVVIVWGTALWPPFLIMWCAGVVLVGWVRARWPWWRWLVRRLAGAELALLRAVLGRVPVLRGRGEPRLWVSGSGRVGMTMPTRHDMVVSRGLVDALVGGGVSGDAVAVEAGRVRARLAWCGSVLVNVIEVACLPAWVLGRVLPRAWRRPGHPFLVGLAGLCGVAIVQAVAVGRWPTGLILAHVGAGLLLGPVFAARWTVARVRVEAAAVAQLDPAAARMLGSTIPL